MIDTNAILNTTEVARLLGVSVQRVQYMCSHGQIPHARKGLSYLFARKVIESQFAIQIQRARLKEKLASAQMSLQEPPKTESGDES